MKVFKDSHPDVDVSALMRSQKLTMADIGIGGRGQWTMHGLHVFWRVCQRGLHL